MPTKACMAWMARVDMRRIARAELGHAIGTGDECGMQLLGCSTTHLIRAYEGDVPTAQR